MRCAAVIAVRSPVWAFGLCHVLHLGTCGQRHRVSDYGLPRNTSDPRVLACAVCAAVTVSLRVNSRLPHATSGPSDVAVADTHASASKGTPDGTRRTPPRALLEPYRCGAVTFLLLDSWNRTRRSRARRRWPPRCSLLASDSLVAPASASRSDYSCSFSGIITLAAASSSTSSEPLPPVLRAEPKADSRPSAASPSSSPISACRSWRRSSVLERLVRSRRD